MNRKTTWCAALFALLATACSSDTYPTSDIFIEGFSQQESCEYVYFRVPDGSECAGIRICEEGTNRILSFIHADGGGAVDSVATMPNDYAWEGMFRVEIPTEGLSTNGGEMTVLVEGGGKRVDYGTFGYAKPDATDSD